MPGKTSRGKKRKRKIPIAATTPIAVAADAEAFAAAVTAVTAGTWDATAVAQEATAATAAVPATAAKRVIDGLEPSTVPQAKVETLQLVLKTRSPRNIHIAGKQIQIVACAKDQIMIVV